MGLLALVLLHEAPARDLSVDSAQLGVALAARNEACVFRDGVRLERYGFLK